MYTVLEGLPREEHRGFPAPPPLSPFSPPDLDRRGRAAPCRVQRSDSVGSTASTWPQVVVRSDTKWNLRVAAWRDGAVTCRLRTSSHLGSTSALSIRLPLNPANASPPWHWAWPDWRLPPRATGRNWRGCGTGPNVRRIPAEPAAPASPGNGARSVRPCGCRGRAPATRRDGLA